ncbi:hypothetical protein RRG08_054902 [Elysia crispata]|uniref:Uncharacterized protein n=1 Tax=Elysia crispata TaxID=231223 RepID=A0AAE1A5X9_9GAST|nr:hypothetical protein RRG08_054902 [Elysia crispata]
MDKKILTGRATPHKLGRTKEDPASNQKALRIDEITWLFIPLRARITHDVAMETRQFPKIFSDLFTLWADGITLNSVGFPIVELDLLLIEISFVFYDFKSPRHVLVLGDSCFDHFTFITLQKSNVAELRVRCEPSGWDKSRRVERSTSSWPTKGTNFLFADQGDFARPDSNGAAHNPQWLHL